MILSVPVVDADPSLKEETLLCNGVAYECTSQVARCSAHMRECLSLVPDTVWAASFCSALTACVTVQGRPTDCDRHNADVAIVHVLAAADAGTPDDQLFDDFAAYFSSRFPTDNVGDVRAFVAGVYLDLKEENQMCMEPEAPSSGSGGVKGKSGRKGRGKGKRGRKGGKGRKGKGKRGRKGGKGRRGGMGRKGKRGRKGGKGGRRHQL